jgi:uncharacterized protein YabE (DUF348 family)
LSVELDGNGGIRRSINIGKSIMNHALDPHPHQSINHKESAMKPIRNLSILILFILATASASAATADMNVIITVNITATVNLQWSADLSSASRYWRILDGNVNTSYDSDSATTQKVCSDAAWTLPVADGLSVKNASQRPVSLTIAVTAQTVWTHAKIAGHTVADVYTIRAATGGTHALDTNLGSGLITDNGSFTLELDVLNTAVSLATNVARNGIQTLRLEFITPLDVSAGKDAATMTVTVHGTAL